MLTHAIITNQRTYHGDGRPTPLKFSSSEQSAKRALSAAGDIPEDSRVVTVEVLNDLIEKYHLDAPGNLEEVSREEYENALNALPPLKWERTKYFGRFFLPEAKSGTIHRQYARYERYKKEAFVLRDADVTGQKTWITREEVYQFITTRTSGEEG